MVLRMHLPQGKVNECNIPLDTADGVQWKGDYIYTYPSAFWFEYQYVVRAGEQTVRREWKHAWRRLRADMTREYFLPDSWQAIPSCDHLYSAAFSAQPENDPSGNSLPDWKHSGCRGLADGQGSAAHPTRTERVGHFA